MKTQTFHMPNQLDAVDPMVLSLKQYVESHLSDEARFRFDICVSEALTNLVLHAKTPLKGAQIDVSVTVSEGKVVVDISDPEGAAAFDLRDNARALSEVDSLAEGGRGLGLILECADDVDYGTMNQRNRLSLAFHERG